MKRNQAIIALLLFSISFGVYLKTLCPTVYVGDSGELIAASYILGIPHPPGYPLYCLLGRLFTFLPLGSIAFRINLMSAFFASLTVVLVYLVVLKIQNLGRQADRQTGRQVDSSPIVSHIPAFAAALIFAFSSTFWSQAVIAEVYTLNAFFAILVIFILYLWSENRERKYLYCFSLLYGLSLTNHYTMLLFIPGFIFYILSTDKSIWKEKRTILSMFCLFLLGLSPFSYLFLRSLANPAVDWGNPENLTNFLAHITRSQYRELSQLPTLKIFLKQLFYPAKFLVDQLPIYIGALSLFGLPVLFKKNRKWFYATLIFFLSLSLGVTYFKVFQDEAGALYFGPKFYIPSYIFFIIWIGYGLHFLFEKGAQINKNPKINWGGRTLYKHLSLLLILILPLASLTKNYFQNDKSSYYLAYDLGMNILKTLDEKATIFTSGDAPTFVLAYLSIVEKRRPDITIYHRHGAIFENIYGISGREWPSSREREMIRDAVERRIIDNSFRPIYYANRRKMEKIPGYTLKLKGIIYEVTREGEEEKKRYYPDYRMRGIDDEKIFKDYQTKIMLSEYYYRLGRYYSRIGEREEAFAAYTKASSMGWEIMEYHYLLSQTYQGEGMIEAAIIEYERALKFEPDSIPAQGPAMQKKVGMRRQGMNGKRF